MTDIYPPVANNRLNALGSFVQRDFYDKRVYSDLLPKPLDMWYDKPLYGRLDHKNIAVFPTETKLKQLRGSSVFALDFVVDAYEDLRRDLQSFLDRSKITEDSNLVNLNPETAWESSDELYHLHMSNLYTALSENFLIDEETDSRIVDIQTFVKEFIRFFDQMFMTVPFTRTGFTLSAYCSPAISGMVIQIQREDHSEDRIKYERFIDDPNFAFYTRLTQQFGFKVDKNAPWQLVADLGSPAMKTYFDQRETKFETLFDTHFYKVYEFDVEALKIYITQMYNSYIEGKPTVKIFKQGKLRRGETLSEIKVRKPTSLEALNKYFNQSFWLRLYSYMRACEINCNLSQVEFDNFHKKIKQIAKFISYEEAIKHINKTFKGAPASLFRQNDKNMLITDMEFIRKKKFNF